VWRSGGVSASGWRRTGQGALVGCSGAGGGGGGGLATVPSGEEVEGRNAGA
jgi:hypothetical protein